MPQVIPLRKTRWTEKNHTSNREFMIKEEVAVVEEPRLRNDNIDIPPPLSDLNL